MRIEFDLTKDATNQEKHGVSLSLVESFEWDVANVSGETLRAISLRRANRREVLKFVDQA
jgi:uncharacterized DUF497 family protein